MAKLAALSFLILLFISGLPVASGATISTQTTSSSNLVPFTGTHISNTPSPLINGFGTDIHLDQFSFSASQFSFSNLNDNLTILIGASTLNGQNLLATTSKNTTVIQMSFSTFNIQFRNTSVPNQKEIILVGSTGTVGNATLNLQFANPLNLKVGNNCTPIVPCHIVCFDNLCYDWGTTECFFNAQTLVLSCSIPPSFNIDPLAVDDQGGNDCVSCASDELTIVPGTSNDVIIVYAAIDTTSGTQKTVSTITDTIGTLTWTLRSQILFNIGARGCASTNCDDLEEWYTVWSGHGSIGITVTATASTNIIWNSIVAISGATTGNCGSGGHTCFDVAASLPATHSVASGTSNSVTISTANTNDFLLTSNLNFPAGQSPPSGFTNFGNSNSQYPAYDIVSATQSAVTETFTWSTSSGAGMTFDAVCAAGGCSPATVTQPIKITTLTAGAPSCTVGISGAGVSNSSFTGNGNTHTYSGITATGTITLTLTAAIHTRCEWNISPHPTASLTITFQTCGSGTCSTYSNNSYYQLNNNMTATPQTPSTWDAIYTISETGTFLGVGSHTFACPNTVAGGGVVACNGSGKAWFDYNLQVCLPSQIGNTWNAALPNCFTDTIANNVHNVNYLQSSGGGPPNFDWLLLAPFLLIGLVIVAGRKKIFR